jgi:hypothetical protein
LSVIDSSWNLNPSVIGRLKEEVTVSVSLKLVNIFSYLVICEKANPSVKMAPSNEQHRVATVTEKCSRIVKKVKKIYVRNIPPANMKAANDYEILKFL